MLQPHEFVPALRLPFAVGPSMVVDTHDTNITEAAGMPIREFGEDGPATGIGSVISIRLYATQEAALNAWIERQPDPKPSRSEALRRLVERGLEAEDS